MQIVGVYLFLVVFNNYSHGLRFSTEVYRKQNSLSHKMTFYSDDVNIIQNHKSMLTPDTVNDLIQDIQTNKLSRIFISNDYHQVVSVDNAEQYHTSSVNPLMIQKIIDVSVEHHIDTNFLDFNPSITNIQNILSELFTLASYTIPMGFIFLFLMSLFSQDSMSPMNISRFRPGGMSNSRNVMDKIQTENLQNANISFSSWAGSPEVLEECREVISYLDNKELFREIGAEMPKGILLEGPPGTGKTLLAKAIASESNSSFISISASEFVELFVGMGAARVREVFSNARENKPCVIFIDEIDAIGKQRGTGINMANDEREQTLNQLLYEMDGFNNNEDILVLSATNRKDVLDQALLRPGRFDRIIKVPLPDKYSRVKIIEYYIQNKNTEKGLDITSLAELTDGYSGAQLKNLINEAAIMAAKQRRNIILEKDIFQSFEKSIVGLVKQNNDVSLNTRTRVAIHESGHALLALQFPQYFELQKVSIQATYNGAGGYTIFNEKTEIKEGGLYTKDILKKRLIVTLGGKAAETVYYGKPFVSLGAVEDLKQANRLARRMISNFGMGNQLEVFFNENSNGDNPFLERSLSGGDEYSEYTKCISDKESYYLVIDAYNEAKRIIYENKYKLIIMSDLLLNQTVINKQDIYGLF